MSHQILEPIELPFRPDDSMKRSDVKDLVLTLRRRGIAWAGMRTDTRLHVEDAMNSEQFISVPWTSEAMDNLLITLFNVETIDSMVYDRKTLLQGWTTKDEQGRDFSWLAQGYYDCYDSQGVLSVNLFFDTHRRYVHHVEKEGEGFSIKPWNIN